MRFLPAGNGVSMEDASFGLSEATGNMVSDALAGLTVEYDSLNLTSKIIAWDT